MSARPTRRTLAIGVLLCALALLVLRRGVTHAEPDAWELDETVDGIALYTRESPAHGYDVVKAVATLDARPETLIALLRDIEHFPRWYQDCKAARVIERPKTLLPVRVRDDGRFEPVTGDESYVLFFLQDAAPLEDRWALVQNTVRVSRDGARHIEFHSLDSRPFRAPAGAVRMRLRGRWSLTPVARERTRVSFEVDTDPDTSTPAFLVDPRIHGVATGTLRNLRRVAKEPRSIELGRRALEAH